MVRTLTDIQDQKEAEQKLAEALHIREDFLAIAGHELKTPLTALLMHIQGLQVARKAGVAEAKLDERLEKASRTGDRLATLIDQMLDVSRITAGRLQLEHEDFDLTALISEVSDRLSEQAARAGSAIILEVQPEVTGIWDRLRLEQVVTNLLGNAVKYGQGNPITVTLTADRDTAVLRVSDRGIGILSGQQEKIFERFERAVGPREFGGFGLGLWITRQIVDASGGAISVESALGEGSTFTVRLPRKSQEKP
jgi:signal transduction histidine kinase